MGSSRVAILELDQCTKLTPSALQGGFLTSKNAEMGDTSIDATYSAYTYQAACGVIGSVAAAGA